MSKTPYTNWEVTWLIDRSGGHRIIPAFEYLLDQPAAPRKQLLQILEAVRLTGGPDHWRDATSHDRMDGVLDDLHYARDKHGDQLYRLYLKWQRERRRVWLIDGRTKPNKTAISDAEYAKIRKLADLIDTDPPPAAQVDDFARRLLE